MGFSMGSWPQWGGSLASPCPALPPFPCGRPGPSEEAGVGPEGLACTAKLSPAAGANQGIGARATPGGPALIHGATFAVGQSKRIHAPLLRV